MKYSCRADMSTYVRSSSLASWGSPAVLAAARHNRTPNFGIRSVRAHFAPKRSSIVADSIDADTDTDDKKKLQTEIHTAHTVKAKIMAQRPQSTHSSLIHKHSLHAHNGQTASPPPPSPFHRPNDLRRHAQLSTISSIPNSITHFVTAPCPSQCPLPPPPPSPAPSRQLRSEVLITIGHHKPPSSWLVVRSRSLPKSKKSSPTVGRWSLAISNE